MRKRNRVREIQITEEKKRGEKEREIWSHRQD